MPLSSGGVFQSSRDSPLSLPEETRQITLEEVCKVVTVLFDRYDIDESGTMVAYQPRNPC